MHSGPGMGWSMGCKVVERAFSDQPPAASWPGVFFCASGRALGRLATTALSAGRRGQDQPIRSHGPNWTLEPYRLVQGRVKGEADLGGRWRCDPGSRGAGRDGLPLPHRHQRQHPGQGPLIGEQQPLNQHQRDRCGDCNGHDQRSGAGLHGGGPVALQKVFENGFHLRVC